MAGDSNHLELKKILVDLEDERRHLRASIGHLEHEIQKRELEVQNLLAERELSNITGPAAIEEAVRSDEPIQHIRENVQPRPKFNKQVEQLLKNISKTSEEVFSLVRI